MKSKISIVLLLSLVVCLCAFTTLSQGEEQKPQLLMVEEAIVPPANSQDYEAVLKEFLKGFEKYKWPYPFRVYMDYDFHYYFSYPMKDFAEVEKVFSVWEEIVQKWGPDKVAGMMKRMGDAFQHNNFVLMYAVPELSYEPANPRLKEEERKFIMWDIWYPISGREAEVEGIFKKIKEIVKSKNINIGFVGYRGVIGAEMPAYMTVGYGKDIADFWGNLSKMWDMIGEEFFTTFNEGLSLLRKRDLRMGLYRPDLSYMPKE
ncbi:hypothetical protein ACFLT2_03560 [Acidobacteriota bacterium]